ncbi:MAG: DUF5666 domain-containing protein, partial [Dehalococcoidia bacterium]
MTTPILRPSFWSLGHLLKVGERSNTGVTTNYAEFNSWGQSRNPLQNSAMFRPSEKLSNRMNRPPWLAVLVAFAILVMAFAGNATNVASAASGSGEIEAVFGTAVEVRPPSAIVIASSQGLLTLIFDSDSELKIGSRIGTVADVTEGDRVISTATRNADNELVAVKTLIRVVNSQPITKHVVGVVTGSSADQLSIQTRKGDVVDVLIPAGIDAPVIGDGITMVVRLDRSSGVLTAVGFELTSKTVKRIQDARDRAANQAESARLALIAVEARSKHLSALDDAARALKRIIDSQRVDEQTLEKASSQFAEIQRRFNELKSIYEAAARGRNESQPLLRLSGALVDEIGSSTFTVIPNGEQDADPFSVEFTFDQDSTMVDLPHDLLRRISTEAKNPQLLSDVKGFIEPGSELDVRYLKDGDVRKAVSINVRLPRLVEELETVLEHESLRAFHGVITLVEEDDSLEDALGIVIAANENQGVKVAAKVTDDTEITLDGEPASIADLAPGQAVGIQFESLEAGSISDITGSDITLRALSIRARSSAPVDEDHISGVVESLEVDVPAITIRPTNGPLIRLFVGPDAPIVRDGKPARLENVRAGDLVVDATRTDSGSTVLTSLVVVARANVKFAGTVTGIRREPPRLQVTGDNGQLLNVLVTGDTWVILDGARVKFGMIKTGMNIVSGVYAVAGRGGALYNVATIVSIESPKVGRTTGIITRVNVVEGTLTIVSGSSSKTRLIDLKLPEHPLGDNLLKDGLPIRSLLEVERGDRVDIVFYVLKTGIIEKLSVVSDNFMQARGTLLGIADNNRFAEIELTNGEVFELWVGPGSNIKLNGRRIPTLRPVSDLFNAVKDNATNVSALVPEVLFNRDSLDSNTGVIIAIQFQIKINPERIQDGPDRSAVTVELTVSGVIEAINGDTWVIDGRVFTVTDATRFLGEKPEVGIVAVAVLVSRPDGMFTARAVSV